MRFTDFITVGRNRVSSVAVRGIASVSDNNKAGDSFLTHFAGVRLIPAWLPSLGTALLVLLATTTANAQVASPGYALMCTDAQGDEYFNASSFGHQDNINDFEANIFENWSITDHDAAPGGLNDITVVNQASDAVVPAPGGSGLPDTGFHYYQIVTNTSYAAGWGSSNLIQGMSLELAFGDCYDASTRYQLLLSLEGLNSDHYGSTWVDVGCDKIVAYSDSDTGNDAVGGEDNDGPLHPGSNDTSLDAVGDLPGYDKDYTGCDSTAIYARLSDTNGDGTGTSTIEVAISRAEFAGFSDADGDGFAPCFARAWLNHNSSIDKTKYAINDAFSKSDLATTSMTLDNCVQAEAVVTTTTTTTTTTTLPPTTTTTSTTLPPTTTTTSTTLPTTTSTTLPPTTTTTSTTLPPTTTTTSTTLPPTTTTTSTTLPPTTTTTSTTLPPTTTTTSTTLPPTTTTTSTTLPPTTTTTSTTLRPTTTTTVTPTTTTTTRATRTVTTAAVTTTTLPHLQEVPIPTLSRYSMVLLGLLLLGIGIIGFRRFG